MKVINRIVFVSILIFFLSIGYSSGKTVIRAVHFGEGDTILSVEGRNLLDTLVFHYSEILEQCPDLIIKLSSHSDSYERKKEDTLLSYERGLAVKNYLVSHGIDKDRLVIQSHGGNQPCCPEQIDGCDNPPCRQLDRRVELTIFRCDKILKK